MRLRHIDRFTDRTGRVRYYVRKGKGPRIPVEGEPNTPAFMASYEAALKRATDGETKAPAHRTQPGTFGRLALDYFASPDFLRLAQSTRRAYRLVIERFCAEHGHRRGVSRRPGVAHRKSRP